MNLTSLRNYLLEEKRVHLFFVVSLWAKGIFALSEIIGGIAAFFVTKGLLVGFAQWATRDEFAEDPHDVIANYLLHSAQNLTIGTQEFAAIYLLGHGVIKLWLIVGLIRGRLWYYPVSLVVFALFIVYQLYRYTITHSVWLLLITGIDVIVIGLIWHEYKYLRSFRKHREGSSPAVRR